MDECVYVSASICSAVVCKDKCGKETLVCPDDAALCCPDQRGYLSIEDRVKNVESSLKDDVVHKTGNLDETIDGNKEFKSLITGCIQSALQADRLNVRDGHAYRPVYFSDGVPVECPKIEVDTVTNAATADVAGKLVSLENPYEVDDATAYAYSSYTPINAGAESVPVYFSGGLPYSCGILNVTNNGRAEHDILGNVIHSHYAPINSPALTGVPTTPNLSSGYAGGQITNAAFVDSKISLLETKIVNGATIYTNFNDVQEALGDSRVLGTQTYSEAITGLNNAINGSGGIQSRVSDIENTINSSGGIQDKISSINTTISGSGGIQEKISNLSECCQSAKNHIEAAISSAGMYITTATFNPFSNGLPTSYVYTDKKTSNGTEVSQHISGGKIFSSIVECKSSILVPDATLGSNSSAANMKQLYTVSSSLNVSASNLNTSISNLPTNLSSTFVYTDAVYSGGSAVYQRINGAKIFDGPVIFGSNVSIPNTNSTPTNLSSAFVYTDAVMSSGGSDYVYQVVSGAKLFKGPTQYLCPLVISGSGNLTNVCRNKDIHVEETYTGFPYYTYNRYYGQSGNASYEILTERVGIANGVLNHDFLLGNQHGQIYYGGRVASGGDKCFWTTDYNGSFGNAVVNLNRLGSELNGYATKDYLTNKLGGYVTNGDLTTTLSQYVTNDNLGTSLNGYVKKEAFVVSGNYRIYLSLIGIDNNYKLDNRYYSTKISYVPNEDRLTLDAKVEIGKSLYVSSGTITNDGNFRQNCSGVVQNVNVNSAILLGLGAPVSNGHDYYTEYAYYNSPYTSGDTSNRYATVRVGMKEARNETYIDLACIKNGIRSYLYVAANPTNSGYVACQTYHGSAITDAIVNLEMLNSALSSRVINSATNAKYVGGSNTSVGTSSTPVYISGGSAVPCSNIVASYLGTNSVGNTSSPVYISGGQAVACGSVQANTIHCKYTSDGHLLAVPLLPVSSTASGLSDNDAYHALFFGSSLYIRPSDGRIQGQCFSAGVRDSSGSLANTQWVTDYFNHRVSSGSSAPSNANGSNGDVYFQFIG